MFGRWLTGHARPGPAQTLPPRVRPQSRAVAAAGPRPGATAHGAIVNGQPRTGRPGPPGPRANPPHRRRRPLPNLPGWERASIWGWDPPGDNYFAVLWRNPATGPRYDEPDIWIHGWENIGGELYRVTTTHMLAMEISLATGRPLPEVCAALGAAS